MSTSRTFFILASYENVAWGESYDGGEDMGVEFSDVRVRQRVENWAGDWIWSGSATIVPRDETQDGFSGVRSTFGSVLPIGDDAITQTLRPCPVQRAGRGAKHKRDRVQPTRAQAPGDGQVRHDAQHSRRSE